MLTDRRLADRYVLADALGRGGMGTVWRAHDELLRRTVAIKEVALPPAVGADDAATLRNRVLREARAAAQLSHPNATTVFDVVDQDGKTWIVMEYVDAPTLADVVERNGPVSPQRAAEIGAGVLAALTAAHRAGIVHRDVKPGNVMIPREGPVKLTDFGVASVAGDPKLTTTGLIIGSPSYMAPEQASEGQTSAATDLWGLGTTLYFAVEGASPFDRGQAIPTLTAVVHDDPRPMRNAGPLAALISRLLAKDPASRPSPPEVAAELNRVATEPIVLDDTVPTPASDAAPTLLLDSGRRTTDEVPPAPVHHREEDDALSHPQPRAGWVMVILAAIALLALAGWMLLRPTATSDGQGGERTAQQDGNGDGGDQAAQRQDQSPADTPPEAEQGQQQQPATPDDEGADEPADEAPPGPAGDEQQEPSTPAGMTRVEISPAGASVAVPASWEQRDADGNATDYVDPDTGSYLRVDWTDDPGDDAVADWERQSEAFAESHSDYEEISIEPYDYPGYESALWEYRYSSGDATLHAYNLAIAGENYGHALNFQTTEELWPEFGDEWEQMVASFDPGDT